MSPICCSEGRYLKLKLAAALFLCPYSKDLVNWSPNTVVSSRNRDPTQPKKILAEKKFSENAQKPCRTS